MTRVLVQLKAAGLKRGGRWLVRNVDLCVHVGEIVTLIGPNGSGKSTTAKMALGIEKPDSGQVILDKNLRLAYVPQKLHIDWTLPVSVERLMCLTQKLSDQEIGQALAQVGIEHLRHQAIQGLSGGEVQRLLLARALARKPDLLVLDEPVQGVDLAGEIALYELIGQIRQEQGCGILLVSHDLHLVMAETDSVICLNGHVCCRGTAQSVASSPEYRQLFGARAADALAVYAHHHDHVHLPDGRVLHTHPAGKSDHA